MTMLRCGSWTRRNTFPIEKSHHSARQKEIVNEIKRPLPTIDVIVLYFELEYIKMGHSNVEFNTHNDNCSRVLFSRFSCTHARTVYIHCTAVICIIILNAFRPKGGLGNTTKMMTVATTSTVPWNDPENHNLSFVCAVAAVACGCRHGFSKHCLGLLYYSSPSAVQKKTHGSI